MQQSVIFIVIAMTFSAVVLALQAVWFFVKGRRDDEEERIRHRLGVTRSEEEEQLASLLRETAADSALDALGDAGRRLQDTIRQSGSEMTVSALVSQMVGAFVVIFIGASVLIGWKAVLPAAGAAYVPLMIVKRRAESRSKKLLSQVPDALEMMGRAMQTGAGLIDCFRLVEEEMTDPVAEEFGRISDEVRFGKDWRLALDELIKRNPTLFDLRLFVSSILLQRETGGNMIETFHRISKLVRSRYAFDAKVKAMTSEARASGFLLAAMPLAVLALVFVFNGEYLSPLWTTGIGQFVAVGCACSYVLGIFIMQQASTVEL